MNTNRTALQPSDITSIEGGSYMFTENDNQLTGSNTRHLFKNLYGETLLTFLFFSKKNVSNIQSLIRYSVFKESGNSIDNQSVNELLIIMRSIFLDYSAHPPPITEEMSSVFKNELLKQYTKEVSRLNEIVVNTIVPKIVSQIVSYMYYLKDSSESPLGNSINPVNVSTERKLRSITNVLTGSKL